ncbi:hypothetical protein [Streptomyces sp. NPDC052114]|uniref:hypothetical protein n=1 Tax=unclassified Streptomyces TaxID=2593676 RepID=UPI0034140241
MSRFDGLRPVSNAEYANLIRRYPPSSLLPLIARLGAQADDPARWLGSPAPPPWLLADAAWMSLWRGNEHRHRLATMPDLLEILTAGHNLDDPACHQTVGERLEGLLLRHGYLQFEWQQDPFDAVARTIAVLAQTTPQQEMKAIRPGWDSEVLGCSVIEYVSIATLLTSAATLGQGWVLPETLHGVPGLERVTASDEMRDRVAERYFAATAEQFRRESQRSEVAQDPLLRRFTFNPLHKWPLVKGMGQGYLLPVPLLALRKATLTNIYFNGQARYGNTFPTDLGHLLEEYVGRQFQLLADAEVHREIVYRQPGGDGDKKSVDWIVVFKDLVLLVEVKSRQPREALRVGADYERELNSQLAKGFEQINATAELIRNGHEGFRALPADRSMLGLVVTLGSYYTANSPEFRSTLPQTVIPVGVADIAELESAISITDVRLADVLAAEARPARAGWSLRQAITGHRLEPNAVLEQARSACPLLRTRRRHAPAGLLVRLRVRRRPWRTPCPDGRPRVRASRRRSAGRCRYGSLSA